MTPTELADALDISPKTLRAWLRDNYPRPVRLKWSRWMLSPEIIRAARRRWT